MKMTFGQAVRALRLQAKLGQQDIADAVGKTQTFISMIEKGIRGVERDPDLVAKLEKALKVPPGELAKYLPPDHPARKMSAAASGATLKFIGAIAAGGFSRLLPAEPGDYLDVREQFPAGCVLAVVSGPSCSRFNLHDGDLVALKETGEPEEMRFVVAETAEGLTLKLFHKGSLYQWFPSEEKPRAVPLTEDTRIVGVVLKKVGDAKPDEQMVAELLKAAAPPVPPVKKKGRK